jgi:hypothetical protein
MHAMDLIKTCLEHNTNTTQKFVHIKEENETVEKFLEYLKTAYSDRYIMMVLNKFYFYSR